MGENQQDKMSRRALPVAAAQEKVISFCGKLTSEFVSLSEAKGRVLAETVKAPHPYPHFRRSGMDGYAIISSDTAGCSAQTPVHLEVIDEIPCGSLPSVALVPGTAARIMTGAKVPDEADAVVMFEMTEATDGESGYYVKLKREIASGANITPVGLELAEGDVILEAGQVISAGEISVLATFGISEVAVIRKPRVAVMATGSELLAVDEPLQDGRIRNSNTYMLESQIKDAGAEPIVLNAIADDLSTARSRVLEAIEEYDLVISTGGVSVGDFDIMADLVLGDEMEMLFNKVMMRPGSVTTAAVRQGKLLFALSGNPGACFVGFELFVRPAIGRMMGIEQPFLKEVEATLAADYPKINAYTRFVRGRIAVEGARLRAYPAALDESSVMITIKDSNALLVIPPTTEGVQAGELIKVLLLPGVAG